MLNKLRKLLIVIFAVIAVASVLYIAFGLFVSGSFTVEDVFDAFGVDAGTTVQQQSGTAVPIAEDEVKVSFPYVGQGDCAVIRAGDDVVVIDTGEYDGFDLLEAFLAKEGIRTIDLLIITHPHTDHMGSAQSLVRDYGVKEILFTYVPERLTPTNSTYEKLLREIERQEVPVSIPDAGDVIRLDRGTIEVFFAGGEDCGDLNNCSMVMQYVWGNNSFLITGDAEFEVEDVIAERYGSRLESTVLKAGHHGTRYATGNNLLKTVRPEYVVFCCGVDNRYGYPKETVIDRVEKVGATCVRTDLHGDITFVCTKTQMTVYTENEVA